MRYSIAFLAVVAALIGACVTPASKVQPTHEAIVFFTLSDIKTFADAAEKVYGNQVALGHVSTAKQKTIDAKIVRLHTAFSIALNIAKGNPTAPGSSELQKLADELVVAVNALSK